MGVANRAVIGRLPAESTSFVGRRRLLADVKAALAGTRLLTLVGLGGAQPDKAQPLFEEALGIERRLENRDMIVYMLDGLACQAAMVGRPQRAARLLGAAESLQVQTGVRLMRHMEPLLREVREAISTSLGAPAFESEMIVLPFWLIFKGFQPEVYR